MSQKGKRKGVAQSSGGPEGVTPSGRLQSSAEASPHRTRRRRSSSPAGWKKWAFPLAALLFAPVLCAVLLELILRVGGYGYPTEFLIPRTLAGRNVYTENPQYGWRYFPPSIARKPVETVLPAIKPEGTLRIFVLGESAAMGDPEPAYGLCRMLEVMLSEQYPLTRFEVVNAAMTGISSHVVRDIARSCARHEPDLFLVYMGNNEAIGPGGPGTVFAGFSRHLWLTRLAFGAKTLKSMQLLTDFASRMQPGGAPQGWGGLRAFMENRLHPLDERMGKMASHFEENLQEICRTASQAGAKIVLCTVASNLEHCAPFASMNTPALSGEGRAEFERHLGEGRRFQELHRQADAAPHLEKAVKIDPTFAEAHYRLGLSQKAQGRGQLAVDSFRRARDTDALQFRTSTQLNERTRAVAAGFTSETLILVDSVELLARETGETSSSDGLFVDHVHLNFRGNYLLARALLPAIRSALGERIGKSAAAAAEPVPSEQECAERLAFTRWSDLRIVEEMLRRYQKPPYTEQVNHPERLARLRERLDELADGGSPDGLKQAISCYRLALEKRTSDTVLLTDLAELHQLAGQMSDAAELRRRLAEANPFNNDRQAKLAEMLAFSGETDRSEKIARRILRSEPKHVWALHALAVACEKQGRAREAVAHYNETLDLRPDLDFVRERLTELLDREQAQLDTVDQYLGLVKSRPGSGETHYRLGQSLARQNKPVEAVRELEEALRLDPSLAHAHFELGGVLASQQKTGEAIQQYSKAVRIRPSFASAHNNLAVLLLEKGRSAEAEEHFRHALRLKPEDQDTGYNLGLALIGQGQYPEALAHYQLQVVKHPSHTESRIQVGSLHESLGNWSVALAAYRDVLRSDPASVPAGNAAAWLLATSPQAPDRNGEEAVMLAEQACRASQHQDASCLDTLAAAYAEDGRFAEALRSASQAANLARSGGNSSLFRDIQGRIALYERSQPFRSRLSTTSTAGLLQP